MDSLGRRNSRQMARMRRQRSQEWREREFSSSDNEDQPPSEGKQQATPPTSSAQQYRCHVVDEPRIMQYDKDMKGSLDVRGLNTVDRGRLGSAGSQGVPVSNVENRTYAPLSGSDGDTETDDRRSPAVSSLLHQSGATHLSSLLSKSSSSSSPRGRMAIPLQRDPSTSSSDNNSDTTYNDSEVAIMRAGTLVMRNGSGDSPPEPAPPEVPPRGIAVHHTDLVSLRAVSNRDMMTMSGGGRVYAGGGGTLTHKDAEHNRKLADSSGRLTSSQVISNNTQQVHPSLLPAIMPVHPVRNKTVTGSGLVGPANNHQLVQQSSHPLLHSSSALNNNNTHHVHPTMHCTVPQVLPQVTTSTTSPFSATHFQFRKSCAHRCTWKCLAIFLIFVTVLLTSALAYFGAVSTLTLHLESNAGCIVVEDARLASIDVEETTLPPSTVRVPTLYPTRVSPNNHELSPVIEIHFGHQITQQIQPFSFWNIQIKQTQASFARFNFSLSAAGDWALYARRHVPPTITQYDFTEVVMKKDGKHSKRSAGSTTDVSFLHHLDPGWWFLSLYNDNTETHDVSFTAEIASDVSTRCPHNCHNRGTCTLGKCECYQGYIGNACEHSLCPVLCSSHGSYSGGVCHCE